MPRKARTVQVAFQLQLLLLSTGFGMLIAGNGSLWPLLPLGLSIAISVATNPRGWRRGVQAIILPITVVAVLAVLFGVI